MADIPRRRTSRDPREAAEAAFRAATTTPAAVERRKALPGVKEQVTLRVDQEVLAFFQADGPGWQDRMVEALRQAAGLGRSNAAIPVDKLNASNDE